MTAEEIVGLSKEGQALIWALGFFSRQDLKAKATNRARDDQSFLSLYDDSEGARNLIDHLLDAVARARGGHGADSDRLMRRLATTLIRRGDPLPEQLRDFVADALFRAPMKEEKRGPKRKRTRDINICVAVDRIVERYDLKPTRNEATDKVESACSIVAKALTLAGGKTSEGAVVKVWQAPGRRRRRRLLEKLKRNSSYALKEKLP